MTYPDDIVDKVINADCLEVMKEIPDGVIDLIESDPPYGIEYHNGSDLVSNQADVFGGNIELAKPRPIVGDGEEEAMRVFREFLIESNRILRKGACLAVTCSGGGGENPRFANWSLLIDSIIGFKQMVIWVKTGGMGLGKHFRRDYEVVLIGQKPGAACIWNGGHATSNVWRIDKIIPDETEHPTAKPVELMQRVVLLFSNPGDIVLDPFCGAGPTLVACKNTGRHFIGIDIEKRWVDVSNIRLSQEVMVL